MLKSWNYVKTKVHDASGIESPEKWLWEKIKGIFYPIKKI